MLTPKYEKFAQQCRKPKDYEAEFRVKLNDPVQLGEAEGKQHILCTLREAQKRNNGSLELTRK